MLEAKSTCDGQISHPGLRVISSGTPDHFMLQKPGIIKHPQIWASTPLTRLTSDLIVTKICFKGLRNVTCSNIIISIPASSQ